MKRVTEIYLLVAAIFILLFSATSTNFVLDIEEFCFETDEFLNG